MKQQVMGTHHVDPAGKPHGGMTSARGIEIRWQDGPLGQHAEGCEEGKPCAEGCTRKAPNGAFVEGVIAAAIDRLEFYQTTEFDCLENAIAINGLRGALAVLDLRTKSRVARAVEGTHTA